MKRGNGIMDVVDLGLTLEKAETDFISSLQLPFCAKADAAGPSGCLRSGHIPKRSKQRWQSMKVRLDILTSVLSKFQPLFQQAPNKQFKEVHQFIKSVVHVVDIQILSPNACRNMHFQPTEPMCLLKAVVMDFAARARAASTLLRSWRLRCRTLITCTQQAYEAYVPRRKKSKRTRPLR